MTVKLKTPSNGSVSLTPQDTAADVVLTVPSTQGSQLAVADSSGYTYSGGLVVSPQTGFKNRVINGSMVIDQRNNGASVSVSGNYCLDRWAAYKDTAAVVATVQRSTTCPSGFINSLLYSVTTGASVGAGEGNTIMQPIEGLNVADLGWGTVGASPVTLSFWVRSSLTGTFGGSITNSANNRSYPFTYTISSANTFEYKTVTISGDTSGTWLTTNGVGIRVWFGLGVGSTLSGTAGAWAGATYISATGATSVVGTNGATFYITGVQLEKGSVATPFEFRSITQELALCQRYYQAVADESIVVRTTAYSSWLFPVPMRSAPTMTVFGNIGSGAAFTPTAFGFYQSTTNTVDSGVGYTASAEL